MTAKDSIDSKISAFRRQIDAIDDQIIDLLIERTAIVTQVGETKQSVAPGKCPIRAGREAAMLRRVTDKFENTPFLPEAAAAIWRIIIGASTSVEGPLGLSIYAPERDNDLYWLGREYFGGFAPVTRQPHVKRVIGDIIDGKAAVGILPALGNDGSDPWWSHLLGKDSPKIFACLPFVHPAPPGRNTPLALAIGRIDPEPSGDDRSLLVLEADHNVSQNRLQTAFTTATLEAQWIGIATLGTTSRHHLVEIKGFITPETPQWQALANALGASLLNTSFIGAYATPIILNAKSKPGPHGTSAKA